MKRHLIHKLTIQQLLKMLYQVDKIKITDLKLQKLEQNFALEGKEVKFLV